MIFVDTGPLVAIVDAGDHAHEGCHDVLRRTRKQMIVTWPVLTETMHIAHNRGGYVAQQAVWRMFDMGGCRLLEDTKPLLPRIQALMNKYKDTPMDLADASIIASAESTGWFTVFTLDSDFLVYRLANGRPMRCVYPM